MMKIFAPTSKLDFMIICSTKIIDIWLDSMGNMLFDNKRNNAKLKTLFEEILFLKSH